MNKKEAYLLSGELGLAGEEVEYLMTIKKKYKDEVHDDDNLKIKFEQHKKILKHLTRSEIDDS